MRFLLLQFPEWIILAWVIGLLFQEVKDVSSQGFRRYAMQWWNFISLAMVLLFVISYLLRLVANGITGTKFKFKNQVQVL